MKLRDLLALRRFGRCLCLLVAMMTICVPAYADSSTTSETSDDSNAIYVAGDPDCFPLEYYSEQTKSFCGVIPDMLELVSEKTGLSFTYIAASSKNRQKELSRNNQVELVTALPEDQDECDVEELLPILETAINGESTTYCIGFTEIAPSALKQQLKEAFSEISEQEKMGLLFANAQVNPEVQRKDHTIKIILIVFLSIFVLMGMAALYWLHKRKANNSDVMIDERTGIGNEMYYAYAFDQLLSRQSRNLYAVLYIGADTTKISLECGDKAIEDIDRYAATHLNAATASAEYLARIGDGVFVLLAQVPTEQECIDKATAVVIGLNRYIQKFYPDMADVFRAGVLRLCEHPDCNSEAAFYNAKQGYFAALRGETPAEITSNDHLVQSRKQEKLRSSISEAVTSGEFRVYLQLINENKTGKVCGAELLSRWQNSEYGVLRPYEYIRILKETGQILAHDYNMFSAACRQLEMWEEKPYHTLFLTCNFTRISLSQSDFFDTISDLASAFRFDRSRLVIEITEDSIAEDSEIISDNISKCRKMGFKIAFDDMITGFSTFSDLYDNEIDLVKIDRRFIVSCNMARRKGMLSDVISLVHNSGAKVLCEGVENQSQMEFLDEMNCDMMQGFYFCKILPQRECEKFLKTEMICEKSVFEQ